MMKFGGSEHGCAGSFAMWVIKAEVNCDALVTGELLDPFDVSLSMEDAVDRLAA